LDRAAGMPVIGPAAEVIAPLMPPALMAGVAAVAPEPASWRAPVYFWRNQASYDAAVAADFNAVKKLDGFTFVSVLGQPANESLINRKHLELPAAVSAARALGYATEYIDNYAANIPGGTTVHSLEVRYVGQSDEDERMIVGRNANRIDGDHYIQLERFEVRKTYDSDNSFVHAALVAAAVLGHNIPVDTEVFWHCPAVTTVCLTHGDPVVGVVSKFNWAGVLNLDSRVSAELLRGTQKAVELAAVLFAKPLN